MLGLHQHQASRVGCKPFFGNQLRQLYHSQRNVQPTRRLEVSAAAIGPGKKWEHYETTKNGKTVRPAMHIRKGDTVQIITGKDKGKIGQITQVLHKTSQIVVEGINIKFKTKQAMQQGEKGEIVQSESPIHHSNAMLYSEEKKIRSRVGHKLLDNGKKVRYLIKTGEVVDKQ